MSPPKIHFSGYKNTNDNLTKSLLMDFFTDFEGTIFREIRLLRRRNSSSRKQILVFLKSSENGEKYLQKKSYNPLKSVFRGCQVLLLTLLFLNETRASHKKCLQWRFHGLRMKVQKPSMTAENSTFVRFASKNDGKTQNLMQSQL